MKFKEMLENDLNKVFFNTDEFAETVKLYYNGEWFEVRAVIDSDIMTDRKNIKDNIPGSVLYKCDLVLNLLKSELKFTPRKGSEIRINDEVYEIVKIKDEMGMIILELSGASS